MQRSIVSDKWEYNGIKSIILQNDQLRFIFLPSIGGLLWKIQRLRDGLNILYNHRDPSLFSGNLSIYPGEDKIHHNFVGGWFEGFPNAGFTYSNNSGLIFGLHGEAPYSRWGYSVEGQTVRMFLDLSILPLRIEKKLKLEGNKLTIDYRIYNSGKVDIEFSWLQHPCFDLNTFDSSIINLNSSEIEVDDKFHSDYRKFKYGYKASWPNVLTKEDNGYDLSKLKFLPKENFVETIYIKVKRGFYQIINSKRKIDLSINFDKAMFPYLWFWIANGGGGYPWYGTARLFSLELSTSIPATGLNDQIKNGTAKTINAMEEIRTKLEISIN